MKYLKDKIYYSDLYDRHTVERCRRIEKCFDELEIQANDGEGLSEDEKIRAQKCAKELRMYFETGERYLNREKAIQEWMDRDQQKDELYESAEAPSGIRCLACRNILKPTFKELWSRLDKPDRVLFMYDCPNNCLPRRAFFHDGEEWRVKSDLHSTCDIKLDQEEVKDELPDERFAADRDRFCLTEEEGQKYQRERWNMEQMAKFSERWEEEQKARAEKLAANPKGFHLEGAGYTCSICRDSTPEGDNWYDEYGIKCLVCQKAIDDGEIPASLAKDGDSWYGKFDLEHYFNIKAPTLRKWIKAGIIKVRTVSKYGEGVHTELFLLEDNKDFLPPKNLLESRQVSEIRDGQKCYHSEPWYRFVDPMEHLKGYGIIKYMRIVPPEEMKAREEAEKKKWEEKLTRRKRSKK